MPRAFVFGGLKMGSRVLQKYEALYKKRGLDTSTVPLGFASVLSRDPSKHRLYRDVAQAMEQEQAVHLHVLSGACHLITNLFELYPALSNKVVSQVFDSPCHIDGMAPALSEFYGVPQSLTKQLTATLFPDCLKTSERFMAAPIVSGVRTGVVYSDADVISPVGAIETMMHEWHHGVELHAMKTQSKHLMHMRDQPERYESLIDDVLQIAPVLSAHETPPAALRAAAAA